MAKRLLTTQKIVNLSADPVSGTAGEIYYNTVSNSYKYYDGFAWVALSGGGGGGSLPSQSGQSGKFLTTNGTDASWAEVETLPSQTGNSGKYLTTNGTVASWSTVDADKLDGQDGSHYLDWNNTTNKPDPTITLSGDLSGSITLTDLAGGTLTATIEPNSVELGTDTTGQYIASVSGTTNQVNVSGSGTESITLTLSTPQDIHSGASPTFAGATLDSVRVGITAANEIDTSSGNLTIDSAGGTVTIDDNLTVSGNLTVNGTTTTVNSTTITVDDPIITLGGDTAPSSDDGKDRGIEFRYYDTQARLGFMGYNDSTGEFTLLLNATNTGEVFSGTKATLNAHISGSNINAGTVSETYIDAAIARLASPTFTGTPAAPTAAADTNTTQVATTAFVVGQAGSATPLVNGTAAVGTSLRYARQDHVHGTDTTRAPLASPALTGTPTAPTAAVDTNTTQIATTAYVIGQGYLKSVTASSTYAPLASPTFTGTVTAETLDLTTAATATAATSYWVETGSDGVIRPKTLTNVRTEIVTTAAVNSAAATTVGTVTSGTWNAGIISGQYGGTGVANTGKTITVSGNTVIGSSTHTVTLATSANTSVTLPTSGTLATTSNNLGAFASTTSAQLAGVVSDETGSGSLVFATSPTFTTSIIGGASFDVFNTTSTTINAFGAATTLNLGGTPTTTLTANLLANATASGQTKTINIGTAGASSSTTNINIGSAVSGALGTITMNEQTIFPAATATTTSIRLPHGTAPTSPTNGDVWTTTAGIYVRINGTTVGPLATGENLLSSFLLGGM